MGNEIENPFDKIKNLDSWFKSKVEKQENTIEKIKEDVKAQETEPSNITIYAKGRIISQTVVDANQVQSYIRIIDDKKDGYILTGKEFYITSSLATSPSLNAEVEIAIRW